MGLCFICNSKIYGEQARVCSSVTPLNNVPYPEKIAELIGEDYVVVVTPADYMCKKCTSLFTHMDKLENDLKLVKNAMISYIQKKYGLLPADQPIRTLDIVNGHLKTDELLIGQRKVPSGLNVRDNYVNPSSKMLKTQNDNTSKNKIYKCGFCSFQSKELGHVRFHMRSHMNKKGDGDKIVQQTVTKALTQVTPQQKKRLYRCQVCSLSFDSRVNCLDHIQKDHNQNTTTANEEKRTEEIPLQISKVFLPKHISNFKAESNQQAQFNLKIEQKEQDNNAVDTNMFNENEGTSVGEQGIQHMNHVISAQEAIQVNQIIPNNIVKGVDIEINSEDKTDDLDIESMLAAIHNELPPDNGDA